MRERSCTELHQPQAICDAGRDAAAVRFGEHAVIDLIGITGRHTMLSMAMNAASTSAPASSAAPLPGLIDKRASTS